MRMQSSDYIVLYYYIISIIIINEWKRELLSLQAVHMSTAEENDYVTGINNHYKGYG